MIMMKEQIETSLESSFDDFKETFNEFDKDRNGLITVKEFKKGMAKRGERMSEKYFIQMMKEGDLDGGGCINYQGMMEFTFYLFLLHKTHFIIK
jgi:calcium-dependent protein kinase